MGAGQHGLTLRAGDVAGRVQRAARGATDSSVVQAQRWALVSFSVMEAGP